MSDASLSGPLLLLLAGYSPPLPFEVLIPEAFWPWHLPEISYLAFAAGEALLILQHKGFQVPSNVEDWLGPELFLLLPAYLRLHLPLIPSSLPFRDLDRILPPSRKELPLHHLWVASSISSASPSATNLALNEITISPPISPASSILVTPSDSANNVAPPSPISSGPTSQRDISSPTSHHSDKELDLPDFPNKGKKRARTNKVVEVVLTKRRRTAGPASSFRLLQLWPDYFLSLPILPAHNLGLLLPYPLVGWLRVYLKKYLGSPITTDLLRKVPRKFEHDPALPQEIFCSCFNFSVPYPTTRCILPSALQEGSESLDVTWEKQNWTALNRSCHYCCHTGSIHPKLHPNDRPFFQFPTSSIVGVDATANVPASEPHASTSDAANLPGGTVSKASDDVSVPIVSPAASMSINDDPLLRLGSDSGPSSLAPMNLPEADINIEMPVTASAMPSGLELSPIPALGASSQTAVLPNVEMTLFEAPSPIVASEDSDEVDELMSSIDDATPLASPILSPRIRQMSLPPTVTLPATTLPLSVPLPMAPSLPSFILCPARFSSSPDSDMLVFPSRPSSSSSGFTGSHRWILAPTSPVTSTRHSSVNPMLNGSDVSQGLAEVGVEFSGTNSEADIAVDRAHMDTFPSADNDSFGMTFLLLISGHITLILLFFIFQFF
ncbi:hypothetical protein C8J56DRAFT_899236 [Mycena floridula]|nr:hypothetical protein C8J56DRAFT_899236 [Mycena floridula]